MGIVVFCFFLFILCVCFLSTAHLIPVFSCWVKVMGSNFIQVTNFFFPFFLHKWLIVCKKKMLTFDKLYVNNQMVVLCTKFCFDFFTVLLIEEKKCLFWRDQIKKENHLKPIWRWKCVGLVANVNLGLVHSASHSQYRRKTLYTHFNAISNWKYPRILKTNATMSWEEFRFHLHVVFFQPSGVPMSCFFAGYWLLSSFPNKELWQTLVAIILWQESEHWWSAEETNLLFISTAERTSAFSETYGLILDWAVLIGTVQPSQNTFGLSDSDAGHKYLIHLPRV